jgi:hypothetical protein
VVVVVTKKDHKHTKVPPQDVGSCWVEDEQANHIKSVVVSGWWIVAVVALGFVIWVAVISALMLSFM